MLSLSQCPLPCRSLGLWEPTWPGYGREDQKLNLCFVYETLPTLRGWGGCGCDRPVAEAAQLPQPLTTPASYRHAHTHARAWEQGPQGAGEQEKEEKASISPKPCQHRAKKSALLPGSSGEHRGAKCPLPHAQVQPPRHSTERPGCPASSCSPLKTKFLLSVNHSPPRGTADLRSCDGGMWLRRVL